MSSPFHAGEEAIQARLGMRDKMARVGERVIRPFMPDEHRELFEKLPYLIVGSLDAEGHPQASVVFGRPGFVRTTDDTTLVIGASPEPSLQLGHKVGLLGIELSTRRRNRVNGTVAGLDARSFTVHVEQSFGNCPQYISKRSIVSLATDGPRVVRDEGTLLSAAALSTIAQSDTFFVASAIPGRGANEGVDVSHRGGPRGFVSASVADGATVLEWPDYRGNFMFNTLGNIALSPAAGLLFIDFERGATLSLSGVAEIVWHDDNERHLRFRVAKGSYTAGALPFVFDVE
jgi:predicted pyridoxine 5'-phosphate oxidase superfamily flavin-nucleotide-binding protein